MRRGTLDHPDYFLQLRDAVRRGEADDFAFDEVYPLAIRQLASRFWTPVEVAQRAARWLADRGVKRVLDVGSGVGKFCLVAASTWPHLELVGVEQRPHLVEVAEDARGMLGIRNARFLEGDVTTAPWSEFDAFYFYNPFAENLYPDDHPLDRTVELSRQRLLSDVARVQDALSTLRVGAYMLTYNGFGGPIPSSWRLAQEEPAGCDWLRLWVKDRVSAEDESYYLEGEEAVTRVRPEAGREDAEDPAWIATLHL
jgi:SAM-dependent methyltransferase